MIFHCPCCNREIKFDALVRHVPKGASRNEPYKIFLCDCDYCGYMYFVDEKAEIYYFQGISGIEFNPSRRDKGLDSEKLRMNYSIEVIKK